MCDTCCAEGWGCDEDRIACTFALCSNSSSEADNPSTLVERVLADESKRVKLKEKVAARDPLNFGPIYLGIAPSFYEEIMR